MNAAWHGEHVLPRNATLEQRVAWHREHQRACACRPVPASLKGLVEPAKTRRAVAAPAKNKGRARAPTGKSGKARQDTTRARARTGGAPPDPRFAKLVSLFAADASVTTGGKGFGATALKHDGRIFAMLVGGRLVAKLSEARVDELVARGAGERFDPGHGRRMKQWLSSSAGEDGWLTLAREALRFARAG